MSHSADTDLEARALVAFKACCDAPPEALEGALAQACGDDLALRARVERLLAADAVASQTDESAQILGGGDGRQLLIDDLVSSILAGEDEDEPLPQMLGPYRVVALLGAGSMGLVYEAEQARPRRRVAVKTVHPHLRTDAVVDHFRREVELLGSLGHAAIPQVYEAGEEDGTAWLAMELVRGRRMLEHVAGRPARERITLMIEIIDGVAFAHDAGIVHCDLNPDNVLITPEGQPKILDFGLAHAPVLLSPTGGQRGGGFARGSVRSLNAFIAPEQHAPDAVVSPRVDVFALGRLLAAVFADPLPRALRRELDAIIARATAELPAERYATARELGDELRRVLARRPTRAQPGTPLHRLRLTLARNHQAVRAIAIVFAAAALVGLGALVWGLIDRQRAESHARDRLDTAMRRVAELEAQRDQDAADAVFDLFTRMVDHLGTDALHQAWVWRAEREAARGPTERATSAWAEAVTSATSEEAESFALIRLADTLARAGRWRPLDHVLGRVDRLGLGHFDDEDIQSLRFRTATYHRRLAEAAALGSDHPATPIAFAFSAARRVGPGLQFVAPMRWRGRELLFTRRFESPEVRLLDPRADFDTVASATLGASARVQLPRPLAGVEGIVVALDADGRAVLRHFDGGPELALPLTHVHRSIGWFDGSLSALLGSAGYERALIHAQVPNPLGASPRITYAPPAVGAPASDIDALVRGDLDGDGSPELVAALGAWSAYDLRVFRVDAGGAFTPLARRRVGVIGGLTLLPVPGSPPLIAAAKADRYPSVTTFGPDQPYGPPAGIYLFAYVERRLEQRAFLPLPLGIGPVHELRDLMAGDFDGDGLTDLALGISLFEGQVTLLMRQVAPGELEPIMLRDVMPQAVVQVDEDPANELLIDLEDNGVRSAWVLGAGEDQLPPLRPDPASSPNAARATGLNELDDEDPALARVWQGARTLHELGLTVRAAENLEAAAMLAGSHTLEALVLSEAAALRLENGDARPAARLFERAVARASPGSSGHLTALAGAARSWLEAVEPLLALERYQQLLEAATTAAGASAITQALRAEAEAQVSSLRSLLEPSALAQTFAWKGRIGPPLRVTAPESLTRLVGGGLAVRAFSDQDVIARLPVRYAGGRIAIEVELTVHHLEIGAGLRVALRPRGGQTSELSLQVEARGGDQSILRFAVCGTPETGTRGIEGERSIDASPERMRLRVDYWPDGAAQDGTRAGSRTFCQIWRGDETNPYHTPLGPRPALPDGDYELVISGPQVSALVSLTDGRFTLNRLETLGLTLDPQPLTPLEQAHLHYVNGDWTAARDAWRSLPEGHRYTLLAELQLGDEGRLTEALGARLGAPPEADQVLAHAMRTQRARLAPLVFALDPVDFAARLAYSWGITLRYTALPEVREALLDPTLERLTVDSLDSLRIISARAELLFMLGELAGAYAMATRALEAPPTEHPGGLNLLAQCELLAARIALARGDRDTARDHIRRWRNRLPLPELALERLSLDPADAPLLALL